MCSSDSRCPPLRAPYEVKLSRRVLLRDRTATLHARDPAPIRVQSQTGPHAVDHLDGCVTAGSQSARGSMTNGGGTVGIFEEPARLGSQVALAVCYEGI